ncbi:acyl carrier protein [Methylobacterium sp. J-026]|uniref:acyl carrier protein n=1 Tax=Methylobacterium sp. J-026 TaxID=2836624 RepID=UPI001FB94583|nr:acyl carrier protein [Methylobacterium sp. J-026]MCJ2132483.1 acyl carrier protein [Methylobacterium sp. J-026]
MTQDAIYAGLTQIFRDVLADDGIELHPETTADDVEGWDSASHINILLAAEEHFGIRMSSAEIERLTRVGALADLIQAKTQAKTQAKVAQS